MSQVFFSSVGHLMLNFFDFFSTEHPDPQALIVLLRNEIVIFDLVGPVSPAPSWFSLPYTFDIHESPVTCISFFPECPNDLVMALHLMVTQKENPNQSKRVFQNFHCFFPSYLSHHPIGNHHKPINLSVAISLKEDWTTQVSLYWITQH